MKHIGIKLSTITLALLIITASYGFAGQMHTGTVLETHTGGGYTYMLIEENGNNFWIAGPQTSLAKGSRVSFDEQMWMSNFKSKGLNRTFDKIMFAGTILPASSAQAAGKIQTAPALNKAPARPSGPAVLYTVRELFEKKDELNGRRIKVKGKVIKVSSGIMRMTWVHIEDGTTYHGQNKVVFTSKTATSKVGSEVTAQGTFVADRDFGSGYFYPVIIVDSTFSK